MVMNKEITMNIIYRITYKPHLKNNTPPYYYIGSKYDYDEKYMGSPASKQQDWYTGELSISDWWKKETRDNPQDFLFEIIETYDEHTSQELVEEEKRIQLELDVRVGEDYFNKSIATSGWVSAPRTEKAKENIRQITQSYWDSNSKEAQERRRQLAERNKKTKSKEMNERWKNNPDSLMKGMNKCIDYRKNLYYYSIDGVRYESIEDIMEEYDIDYGVVYYRCRKSTSKKYENWKQVKK